MHGIFSAIQKGEDRCLSCSCQKITTWPILSFEWIRMQQPPRFQFFQQWIMSLPPNTTKELTMVNHQIPLVKGTNPPFACIAEPSVTGLAIAWPPHLTDQTIQSFVPGRTIGSWQRMTKVSVSCSMYEDHT